MNQYKLALSHLQSVIDTHLPKMAAELVNFTETGILKNGIVRAQSRKLVDAGFDSDVATQIVKTEIINAALVAVSTGRIVTL
jgi:hypothetical protein